MKNDFAIERGSNYVLVDVCRHVDCATADTFRAALFECKASGLPYCIVDLSACRYIDSSGLGMLLAYDRERMNVIVVVPEHEARHPLASTSLAKYLRFVPSREDAIARTQERAYALRSVAEPVSVEPLRNAAR